MQSPAEPSSPTQSGFVHVQLLLPVSEQSNTLPSQRTNAVDGQSSGPGTFGTSVQVSIGRVRQQVVNGGHG